MTKKPEDVQSRRDDTDESLRVERSHAESRAPADREVTDQDLAGERAATDMMAFDQREANAKMVAATIRAQELAIEAEAAQQRAEESEQQLRKVAEFRELFIGILGHDLRTPLSSIILSASQLLASSHLDSHESIAVSRIIRGSERIKRMIAQLLDLTRARLGGGLTIEPKQTDLREICEHVVEEFEATIALHVEGDLTGTWDRDRLAEVLSNLVGNAIEYRAPGTTVIVVARPDGADVLIDVENQGDPIPADVLPHIFEPFRRAQQRAKSAAGNLGLGLYIAHELVRAHGGAIAAHSAGGTTTFTVRLPRSPPAPAHGKHRAGLSQGEQDRE